MGRARCSVMAIGAHVLMSRQCTIVTSISQIGSKYVLLMSEVLTSALDKSVGWVLMGGIPRTGGAGLKAQARLSRRSV